MKAHLILYLLTIGLLSSCNKDFMERYPKSEISPQLFFQSESDLNLYANSFYTALPQADIFMGDFSSDNVNVSGLDELVVGRRQVLSDAASAGWTWQPLYNINFFLEQYDNPEISAEARGHYGGIARFFRAFFYFEKVKRFGDVPWYSHSMNTDSPELFKARDSRSLVIDSVMADLDFAIEHVRGAKTVGRINSWAALALKIRVCLFEGTFRKYHPELQLQDSAEGLLQEAANAADVFMRTSPYALKTGDPEEVYLQLFASETPDENEFILARLYGLDVNRAHPANDIFTSATRQNPGLTKSLIDSYLLSNGEPFSSLSDYETRPFWEEVKGRDPRLAQTIRTPGYRRLGAPEAGPALRPDYANALTGYQNIKFVSTPDRDAASYTPLPIFRYAEVLLNYAEALAELGKLTQSEADRSVNLLRSRVDMPALSVAGLSMDPQLADLYDNVSDPLILEVRRERRVELAMEGFRYYDLMRWKQGRLLARTFYGAYYPSTGVFDLDQDGTDDFALVESAPAERIPGLQYFILQPSRALSNGASGNIVVHPTVSKQFEEGKDYVYPLPMNELQLNPQLIQNPGW